MINIKNILIVLSISTLYFSCSKEEPLPVRPEPLDSAVIEPEVGGPNEPNSAFVNLSSGEKSYARRDSWDFGFYCGDQFRVIINYSIFMAAKDLDFTDITAVGVDDVQDLYDEVAVATFDPMNVNYVDDFDGDINNTAIDEINDDNDLNKVYLVNMGFEVGTDTPIPGYTDVDGEHRGWKKIRVLKNNESYIIQYADIDATTYQEKTISKNTDYNFTFFSVDINEVVEVESPKNEWDLNFTVFTNEIANYGTYGFTDFVLTNSRFNVQAYLMEEVNIPYDDFTANDIVPDSFENSQRVIGSSWRVGGGPDQTPHVKEELYYIIKDTEGIYYKMKFITMLNAEGERGYPQFKYNIL
ncbi:MAG: HmuY family protein [Bacteroidota bacterium]